MQRNGSCDCSVKPKTKRRVSITVNLQIYARQSGRMRGMGASRNVKNKFNKKHDAFFIPFSLMYSNVGTEILGNEEQKHRNGDDTSDKPLACDIRQT